MNVPRVPLPIAMPTKFVTVSADPWTGIEDKPGSFARAARALAERRVPVEAFTLGPSGLRVLTSDHRAAAQALGAAGFNTEIADFIELNLAADPAALAKLGEELARAKVNILAAFGVPGESGGRTFLRVDYPQRAAPVLARLLPQAVAASMAAPRTAPIATPPTT